MYTIRCNLDPIWLVRRFEVTGPRGYLLTANADARSAQSVVDHLSRIYPNRSSKYLLAAVNEALKNNVAIV